MTTPNGIYLLYRNHRNVTEWRHVSMQGAPRWGIEDPWHPQYTWLLPVFDYDKQAERTFRMQDILAIRDQHSEDDTVPVYVVEQNHRQRMAEIQSLREELAEARRQLREGNSSYTKDITERDAALQALGSQFGCWCYQRGDGKYRPEDCQIHGPHAEEEEVNISYLHSCAEGLRSVLTDNDLSNWVQDVNRLADLIPAPEPTAPAQKELTGPIKMRNIAFWEPIGTAVNLTALDGSDIEGCALYRCPDCAAAVDDVSIPKHSDWHKSQT